MKTRSVFTTTLLATVALAMLTVLAPAQSVNKRLQDQNSRIKQGVKNGELTRNQLDSLRSRDANIRSRELRDKAHDNGHLTANERRNLNKSLNQNSKAIYRDKHDAAAHGN